MAMQKACAEMPFPHSYWSVCTLHTRLSKAVVLYSGNLLNGYKTVNSCEKNT